MRAQQSPNWQNTPPVFLGNSKPETGINSHLKRVKRSTGKYSVINPKRKGVINPALLILVTGHKTPQALDAMRCRVKRRAHESQHRRGLLLIPFNSLPVFTPHKTKKQYKKVTRLKPKKSELKQNRKAPSKKGLLIYEGITYRVNTGAKNHLPIYTTIVKRMIEQLNICLDKWGRVYAVRIDLHQKFYRGDSKLISRFICNYRKAMLKEYGFNEFGYQWTREVEKSKACHYHLVFFFNGKKIGSRWTIHKLAKQVWEKIKTGNTVPYWDTSRSGKADHDIRANDHEALLDAVYHFSYLAKTRGKGYRDPRANDFNSSRLTKRVRLPA